MYLCEFNKGIELVGNDITLGLIDAVAEFVVNDKFVLKGLVEVVSEYLAAVNWIEWFDG